MLPFLTDNFLQNLLNKISSIYPDSLTTIYIYAEYSRLIDSEELSKVNIALKDEVVVNSSTHELFPTGSCVIIFASYCPIGDFTPILTTSPKAIYKLASFKKKESLKAVVT